MAEDLLVRRNQTPLLLRCAGTFRSSELVAPDVEDLRFTAGGCCAWIAAAKKLRQYAESFREIAQFRPWLPCAGRIRIRA